MVNINLRNFLKNKYFRIIVILFVILFLVFAVNSLFSSSRFSELKNNELNQYEYIPTLNGQCIYETKEIATWIKKTTIDTFNIVLNPEIGFFDFKCLGKISGSSLLQNYKIDSNIENIDLVVYPTFLLSHFFIFLIAFSFRKKRLLIKKQHITFLLLIAIFIKNTDYFEIYYDSYSWIFLFIISYSIDKISQQKKYVLFFLTFLFSINSLNVIIFTYILILFISVNQKYFNMKIINSKSGFSLILLLYLVSRVLDLSYSMRLNNDHYVWIVSAMRMEYYDLNVYSAAIEHKGPVIMFVYFLILKIFGISNIWLGISVFYLFSVALIAYLIFQILKIKFSNENFIFLILSFLILILTLDPNAPLLKFDTRFLGSTLLLIALYFYLVKENLKYFTFFTFLASFTIGSFVITHLVLSIFVWIMSKFNKETFMKLFIYNFIWTSLSLIYLFFTEQLYDFYVLNIKFNLALSDTTYYYSLEQAIKKNIIPFLIVCFSLLIYLKIRKVDKYSILIIWPIIEILHLKLTGPRFPDYQVILYIPFFLCLAYLLLFIYEDKKQLLYQKIFLFLFVTFAILFPEVRSYPINNIGSDNILIGNRIFMSTDFKNSKSSSKYEKLLVNDKSLKEYKAGVLIANLDQTRFDAIFKYNIIPSTRMWYYSSHYRSSSVNWNNFYSDENFSEFFNKDMLNENPKIVIFENTFNPNDTYLNLLSGYISQRNQTTNCFEQYCVMELSN